MVLKVYNCKTFLQHVLHVDANQRSIKLKAFIFMHYNFSVFLSSMKLLNFSKMLFMNSSDHFSVDSSPFNLPLKCFFRFLVMNDDDISVFMP